MATITRGRLGIFGCDQPDPAAAGDRRPAEVGLARVVAEERAAGALVHKMPRPGLALEIYKAIAADHFPVPDVGKRFFERIARLSEHLERHAARSAATQKPESRSVRV